jgi:hypothetical protein
MSECRAANRDDPLWGAVFNAITAIPSSKYIIFSRRVAMADAAWLVATSDEPVSRRDCDPKTGIQHD